MARLSFRTEADTADDIRPVVAPFRHDVRARLRFCGPIAALTLLLAADVPSRASAQAPTTSGDGAALTGESTGGSARFEPRSARPAVVTCGYLDARGIVLRASSGLLMEDGLVVPYSSLHDASMVEVRARDGRSWNTSGLIALHPEADLALLELDDIPDYAVRTPTDLTVRIDEEIALVRGPDGPGPNSLEAALGGRFDIGGPDFVAITKGHEEGAAAFRQDGTLLGICFDLSEQGYELAYLVSAASVVNLLESQGERVSLGSISPPEPPAYKARSNALGLAFRGALLQSVAKPEAARRFLELALKKDPSLAQAHFWTGRVDFAEQRFGDAAAAFQKAATTSDGYPLAWHMAGASYNQAGDYRQAIAMYRKALEIDPRSALSWTNLGSAEFNQQNFPEAEAAFEKAIEFGPSSGLAYYNLGVVQLRTGRREDAEETYEILSGIDQAWAQQLKNTLDAN